MHGVAHIPGGPDPTWLSWESTGEGGGGGGGGIDFDVTPQEGGFLELTTSDYQLVQAKNYDLYTVGAAEPDGHIRLDATGTITIEADSDLSLSGAFATLNGGAEGVYIAASRSGTIARIYMGTTGDPAGWIWVRAPGGMQIDAYAGEFLLALTAGVNFRVTGLPTTDPGVTGALWSSSGDVVLSGYAGGGGGGGGWTLLSTTTLASAGTFDVSSISSSYNDLMLVVIARATDGAGSDGVICWFNNDSGNNYSTEFLEVVGTSLSGALNEGVNSSLNARIGTVSANGATANHFGMCEATILGYASTTWKKVTLWRSWEAASIATSNMFASQGGMIWNNTAAINRVQVRGRSTANLAAGSQLRIYGRT
jgi:hypothetical protein